MTMIDTDYLIVGAGAAGLAFADALIAESDADVVIVDRRDRPGGHWNDAYPFVRLHQPSAYYGVNSRVLGSDSIDAGRPERGLVWASDRRRDAATTSNDVLEQHLLASGRVRFFGDVRLPGRLVGRAPLPSRIQRAWKAPCGYDAGSSTPHTSPQSVPSTHTPSFGVDPDVRLIPINDLVALTERGSGYTVIGAGKTAMDACGWLLDSGVAPEAIRWIRPRDTWLLDRAFTQPHEARRLALRRGLPAARGRSASGERRLTSSAGLRDAVSSSGSTRPSSPPCIAAPPSARTS